MTKSAFAAVLAASAVLAGCATAPQVGPVEVTRFHRPELASAPRGAITIAPAPGNDPASIPYRSYAAAVSQQLARLGYSRGAGGGETIALVDVRSGVLRADRARSPVSLGLGGSTGGWNSGVGVGVGINLSGQPKDQVQTELAVSLRDRSSGQAIWEGRARFAVAADSPLANSQAGADKMAQALFQGFPGQSGETILVR